MIRSESATNPDGGSKMYDLDTRVIFTHPGPYNGKEAVVTMIWRVEDSAPEYLIRFDDDRTTYALANKLTLAPQQIDPNDRNL